DPGQRRGRRQKVSGSRGGRSGKAGEVFGTLTAKICSGFCRTPRQTLAVDRACCGAFSQAPFDGAISEFPRGFRLEEPLARPSRERKAAACNVDSPKSRERR